MSLTPLQEKNKVVIAVAGSGKTTALVKKAIASKEKRILFITYTLENLSNIKHCFLREIGYVPDNVEIISWFSFLLRDGVRPYHNLVSTGGRVSGINFVQGSSAAIASLRFVRESDTERFYFDRERRIYTDKISKYACVCNDVSGGLVIERLQKIYSSIYIDEIQDLAGWDLEFLKLLFHSMLGVTVVGDPRQVTYSTNHSNKNAQFKDEKMVNFFLALEKQKVCEITTQDVCVRCNTLICQFANSIYPEFEAATSENTYTEGVDGILILTSEEAVRYADEYKPQVLRYNKNSNTLGLGGINFGASKGLTFDRVLIFPTSGIKKFIKSGNIEDIGDRAKFYVAVTRARHSVAIVID